MFIMAAILKSKMAALKVMCANANIGFVKMVSIMQTGTIKNGSIESVDPGNLGVASGFVLLSCIVSKI